MSEATDTTILASIDGGVLTLRLNRPEKKNALTQAMYANLAERIVAAGNDPMVRVLLIAGQPGAFCAGNDMVDFMRVAQSGGDGDSPVIRFMKALAAFPKPVVASVNGLAIGVGVTVLLHCDLIYADEDARFALPFVNIGIVPEYASTYLLPRIMGHARAMELALLGEPFTAAHARECGLINEVLADGDAVEARALERAQRLAQQPPHALRTTKRLMKRWTDTIVADAIPLETSHLMPMLSQPEAQEAIGAFIAKRKPDFSKFS